MIEAVVRLHLQHARNVHVLGDLVEAELLVIVRPDPLGRIERALLQRRIDVAAGDLLRHDTELGEHASAEARDAHLHAVEIGRRLDLLAEPAERLATGIARRDG